MLRLLLDPVFIKKSKKYKNQLKSQRNYNNISTIDSTFINKNINYINKKNSIINNSKNKNIDKEKKKQKININCLNKFIDQLNINID